MRLRDGRLGLSPSDLNNFLACEHRTALDLRRPTALARFDRPDRRSVAAAVAERVRKLSGRRIGRCPACRRPVRGGEDFVRLEGAVFHSDCPLRW